MFILLPVVIIVSSASTICLLSYCKTRNLKTQQAQRNNVTSARILGARQPVSPIYIIPTTSQVREMYVSRVINNQGELRNSDQCKPPPEYGQVAVEIPPTYEEATSRVQVERSEGY